MKKLILLFTLILTIGVQAQNLVPNPSFEVYTNDLPIHMNNAQLEYAAPWFDTPVFPGASSGEASPDYIHIDMPLYIQPGDSYEFQSPHSGFGMAGFFSCTNSSIINSFEPFEVRLEEPLIEGEYYLVSFYVKKENPYGIGDCLCGSDELGVYFHTDTIYAITYEEEHQGIENALMLYELDTTESGNTYYAFAEYLQVPDVALDTLINDEENWCLVSDTLYADKPYEFMTFSRFRTFDEISWAIDEDCEGSSYSSFSAFLVDDVSVHLLGEQGTAADAGIDDSICLGDSVQIGTSEFEDYMYWWSPNEDLETSIYGGVNSGMPWVSPTETTTYTLVQKDFAFMETSDQVTITVEECNPGIGEYAKTINIFPNPASSLVEIESIHAIDSWRVLDVLGKEVASSKYLVSSRNLVLDVSSFDVGLYFLEMEVNDQLVIKQLMVD